MTKRLTIALVAVAMFVLLAVMPVSAYTVAPNLNSQGATVFIGEAGLNLTIAQLAAQRSGSTCSKIIGWWASAADITNTAPTKTIDLTGRNGSFTVAPTDFVGYTGNWYIYDSESGNNPTLLFTVVDPTLAIAPWDFSLSSGNDMSGKSIVQGQKLGFKIDTNLYSAINNQDMRFPTTASAGKTIGGTTFGVINDGYLDIKIKDPSGSTLTSIMNASGSNPGTSATSMPYANKLTQLNVSYQPWIWGQAPSTLNPYASTPAQSSWATDALDRNGQYYYPPGTYVIYVESQLNGMKDNYKNAGADYTGKTVSATTTVTLVSDSIKIEANKDSVVRSKVFSVTITGKPSTSYHMWVKGTSSMTGGYDDQPPMITQFQAGVLQDTDVVRLSKPSSVPSQGLSPGLAGNYTFQNGAGKTIWQDVAYFPGANAKLVNGTVLYANVSTSDSGTRTVQWETTNWTKAQKYTIRVEQQFVNGAVNNANPNFAATAGTYYSDEVDVNVEKGAVTIVAAGDQSYYLGEEIKFSGTNTETYTTYLFIMGPNLKPAGSKINVANPRGSEVKNGAVADFQSASVLADNTWSWKWGTSNVALDAGTYTIYAVSQPSNYNNLENAAFGTVSIIIKKPFVSATASQSTVAQGDEVFITGTAEGNPIGVKVWILGKNYPTSAADVKTQSVNADASFKYEISKTSTKNLYPGQYFVVVQHPMQNNVFDVTTVADATDSSIVYVKNLQLNAGTATAGTKVFTLLGAGSLQGSDAAEALVQGLNSPNVDDTYTKLQFLVEVPVIRIDPVGDKHVGDKFTITAATNLAVDDEVLVQVYSSSFTPTQKSQSGEFSGATGTVKVARGDSGMNKISFDVDSSTFKPDEYIVTAEAILQVATGTALFNVLEGTAPVVTTAVPVETTAMPTAVPTTEVTTVPTPIPTTKSPGYGALIALIGLGAVAFIVVRRH